MDPFTHMVGTFPRLCVFQTDAIKHFYNVFFHGFTHFDFVITDFGIHFQYWQAPGISDSFTQANLVTVIRQDFAESYGAHGPLTGLAQRLFQCCANAKAIGVTIKALTYSVTLEAKAAQEVALVTAPVSETRNVNTGRTATVNIFV